MRSGAHDEGYFSRGRSVLRRVHEERMVGLLYGQRALCIGAVMPLELRRHQRALLRKVGSVQAHPDFRAYWREQLASDKLFLTPEARYLGYATAFEIPLRRPTSRASESMTC